MRKPDDIPQDVWTRAMEAIYVPGFPGGDLPTAVLEYDITIIVARAIMAERARCKAVAEEHRRASAPSQSDLIGSIVHMIDSGEIL